MVAQFGGRLIAFVFSGFSRGKGLVAQFLAQ